MNSLKILDNKTLAKMYEQGISNTVTLDGIEYIALFCKNNTPCVNIDQTMDYEEVSKYGLRDNLSMEEVYFIEDIKSWSYNNLIKMVEG